MKTMPGFPIQVILQEKEIAAEMQAVLAHRQLEEKFLYWLPESVEAWVQLCSSTEYRPTQDAVQILARAAPAIVERYPLMRSFVGIGCGEGSKDQILLGAYFKQGRRLAYAAADFSQALLERALAGAAPLCSRLMGLKFDIARDQQLALLQQPETPTLYAALGNTLGALDPRAFPRRLRALMRAEDRFVTDAEIFVGQESLRGYDNPDYRKFTLAPLAEMGVKEEDGELHFELQPGNRGTYSVARSFTFHRGVEARLGGYAMFFAAGERISLGSSLKFEEGGFARLIENSGFVVEESWRSDDGAYLALSAAPR